MVEIFLKSPNVASMESIHPVNPCKHLQFMYVHMYVWRMYVRRMHVHRLRKSSTINLRILHLKIRTTYKWVRHYECNLVQGQASGMEWTLHTDLWKSETILISFKRLQKLYWFSNIGGRGSNFFLYLNWFQIFRDQCGPVHFWTN